MNARARASNRKMKGGAHMRFGHVCMLACLASLSLPSPPAHADGARTADNVHRQTAPKDCTRLNGRIGYYGNPWCTPAEQRAWDIWDARRHAKSTRN
jgi:hypothetical protein